MLPICKGKGEYKIFKSRGIKTLIQRSKTKADGFHIQLEALLNESGEDVSINVHKSCYSTYTSKEKLTKHLTLKRKHSSTDQLNVRISRSQVPDFDFKLHCLICGKVCLPKYTKHPDRWDWVIQCETKDRPGLPTFKDVLLDICEQRHDEWGRQVEIRIKGALTDLPAADHKRCYDDFTHIPKNTNLSIQSTNTDDDALNLVIDDMYKKHNLCSWTSNELYFMYLTFGGVLTLKLMYTKWPSKVK